jgi:hypothetical protein
MDGLSGFGTQDAGVVDEDIDIADFFLDLRDGALDRFKVAHVGGDGGEDVGGLGRRGRRLELGNGVIEDILAAANEVDL